MRKPPVPSDTSLDIYIQKDHHLLVQHCQYHYHSAMCYKYDIHSCRFDMDEKNYEPITAFDSSTGELKLRCLHGLVNNFNQTILDCIHCNMDIKFVGSGVLAKAILYYITDYITKSQLKTHVAYAALELAVVKLGEYDTNDDDITVQAKRMLQRCTYAMISQQELSAPQVVSYLMDYDDHFTSHKYTRFNWLSIEGFVNSVLPLTTETKENDPEQQSLSNTDTITLNSELVRNNMDQNITYRPVDSDMDVDPAPETMCNHISNVLTDRWHSHDCLDECQEAPVSQNQDKGSDQPEEAPVPQHQVKDGDHIRGEDSDQLQVKDGNQLQVNGNEQTQAEDNDQIQANDGDEYVVLQVDDNNNLIPRTSVLQDYLKRGNDLTDVCFWDYISRIEKVRKSTDRVKRRAGDIEQNNVPLDNIDSDADFNETNSGNDTGHNTDDENEPDDRGLQCLWDLHLHQNKLLKSTTYQRPRVEFASAHPDSTMHYQRVRQRSKRMVPVPLGPSIPRCDCDVTKERHARLMLVFFKPWSVIPDLKPMAMSWLDAYSDFTQSCHPRLLKLIDNMQLLHECRDSRDDHFSKRNVQRRAHARLAEGDQNHNRPADHHSMDMDESKILAHLEQIDRAWSEKNDKSSETVQDCLSHARDSCLIMDNHIPNDHTDTLSLEMHKVRDDN